jgi:hypothetical protein
MSMGVEQRTHSRVRSAAATCIRAVLGPFSDRYPLDRVATGAAGGTFILAAIALPVTIASVTKSGTVPSWILILCTVVAILGTVLLIKSCQRPPNIGQAEPRISNDSPSRASDINVSKSGLTKSSIDIPKGSKVSISDSTLNESPLRIRNSLRPKRKPDKQ